MIKKWPVQHLKTNRVYVREGGYLCLPFTVWHNYRSKGIFKALSKWLRLGGAALIAPNSLRLPRSFNQLFIAPQPKDDFSKVSSLSVHEYQCPMFYLSYQNIEQGLLKIHLCTKAILCWNRTLLSGEVIKNAISRKIPFHDFQMMDPER